MKTNKNNTQWLVWGIVILFTAGLALAESPLQIASVSVYDFYGEDRLWNPGEFVWLELELTNLSDSTFTVVYGVPDPTFDSYLHPNSNYFFDYRLSLNNAPAPGETIVWDDLECYIASDTPDGHIVTIPVSFYNQNNTFLGTDTIRVPVYGSRDNKGPFFDEPFISAYSLSVGDTITMGGKLWEAGDVYGAQAHVLDANGNIVRIAGLYDDGTHGDTLAGDRVYSGQWVIAYTGDFTVDFKGWDVYNNLGTKERFLNFSSHPVLAGDFLPVPPTGISDAIIIQNITIQGQAALPGDYIGVFDGDLCVGAATYTGTYPLTITAWIQYDLPNSNILDGAISGHPMTFKIRQESTWQILEAQPNFHEGDGTFNEGLTVVEHLSTDAIPQAITIQPGRFNMISFNIQPVDAAMQNVFNDVNQLKIVRDDAGQFYIPSYDINTIGSLQKGKGYQVLFSGDTDGTISNTGTALDPKTITLKLTSDQSYMVGFPYQTRQPAAQVFQAIQDAIAIVHDDEGGYWIPELSINTLGYIEPGKGVRLYVNEAVAFTYPELASNLGKRKFEADLQHDDTQYFSFYQSGQSEAMVIQASDFALNEGDEIAVFDGELCVGAAVFTGSFPFLIPAWEGYASYDIPGFTTGHPIELRYWNNTNKEEFALSVAFENTDTFGASPLYLLQLKEMHTSEVEPGIQPAAFALDQNYPNPFNPETTIRYHIPHTSEVRLTVYNIAGQTVRTLSEGVKQPGTYTLTWNAANEALHPVESGIYFMILEAGTFKQTRKLILLK